MSAATGATVQLHYCMDKLVSMNFSDTQSQECSNCGMKNKQGCCTNEQKSVKLATDYKTTETVLQWTKVVSFTPSYYQAPVNNSTISVAQKFPVTNAPPTTGGPLYLRNCVFLI